jgi:hypothetical protein
MGEVPREILSVSNVVWKYLTGREGVPVIKETWLFLSTSQTEREVISCSQPMTYKYSDKKKYN